MFGWFKKFRPQSRQVGFREYVPTHPFLGTGANQDEGELSAIETLRVATVFACVRVIAQAVGTLPVVLVRRDNLGMQGTPVRGTGNLPRLIQLLQQVPNPRMSSLDMRVAATASLALHGNALIQIRRNGRREPIELNPIHPSLINYNTDLFGLSHQWSEGQDKIAEPEPEYTINGQSEPLKSDEVIHLRGITFDGIYGAPATTIGRMAIRIARSIDRNLNRYYNNNSPRLIFELPEGKQMSEESYRRLVDGLSSAYTGSENSFKPIVGDSGSKVKFANFSGEQSQQDETRISQQVEICRLFGVPPARVGIITTQPRANVEQENLAFVSQTVHFYANVWTSALERTLLTPMQRQRGFGFDIPTRSLTAASLTDRAQAYRSVAEIGCLTRNEIRKEVFGLPPLAEGGEELALPPNMSPELLERDEGSDEGGSTSTDGESDNDNQE